MNMYEVFCRFGNGNQPPPVSVEMSLKKGMRDDYAEDYLTKPIYNLTVFCH